MPPTGQAGRQFGKWDGYLASDSSSVALNTQKEPYPWSTYQKGAIIASMLLQESKGPKKRDLSDKIVVNAEIRALNSTETLKPRASRSAPSWRQTRAMIDSGSSFDIIDPFLAKQLNLQVKPLPRPIAKYLDGSNPTVYGQTSLELRITDQNRQFRHQVAQLLVMDSPDYPMLLGMPWLRRWNPIPDFRAKIISF